MEKEGKYFRVCLEHKFILDELNHLHGNSADFTMMLAALHILNMTAWSPRSRFSWEMPCFGISSKYSTAPLEDSFD